MNCSYGVLLIISWTLVYGFPTSPVNSFYSKFNFTRPANIAIQTKRESPHNKETYEWMQKKSPTPMTASIPFTDHTTLRYGCYGRTIWHIGIANSSLNLIELNIPITSDPVETPTYSYGNDHTENDLIKKNQSPSGDTNQIVESLVIQSSPNQFNHQQPAISDSNWSINQDPMRVFRPLASNTCDLQLRFIRDVINNTTMANQTTTTMNQSIAINTFLNKLEPIIGSNKSRVHNLEFIVSIIRYRNKGWQPMRKKIKSPQDGIGDNGKITKAYTSVPSSTYSYFLDTSIPNSIYSNLPSTSISSLPDEGSTVPIRVARNKPNTAKEFHLLDTARKSQIKEPFNNSNGTMILEWESILTDVNDLLEKNYLEKRENSGEEVSDTNDTNVNSEKLSNRTAYSGELRNTKIDSEKLKKLINGNLEIQKKGEMLKPGDGVALTQPTDFLDDVLKFINEKLEKDITEKLEKDDTEKQQKDVSENLKKNVKEKLQKDINEQLQKDTGEKLQRDFSKRLQNDIDEKLQKDIDEKIQKDEDEKLEKDVRQQLQRGTGQKIPKYVFKLVMENVKEAIWKSTHKRLQKEISEKLHKELHDKWQTGSTRNQLETTGKKRRHSSDSLQDGLNQLRSDLQRQRKAESKRLWETFSVIALRDASGKLRQDAANKLRRNATEKLWHDISTALQRNVLKKMRNSAPTKQREEASPEEIVDKVRCIFYEKSYETAIPTKSTTALSMNEEAFEDSFAEKEQNLGDKRIDGDNSMRDLNRRYRNVEEENSATGGYDTENANVLDHANSDWRLKRQVSRMTEDISLDNTLDTEQMSNFDNSLVERPTETQFSGENKFQGAFSNLLPKLEDFSIQADKNRVEPGCVQPIEGNNIRKYDLNHVTDAFGMPI